jgi:hypothetical protein
MGISISDCDLGFPAAAIAIEDDAIRHRED